MRRFWASHFDTPKIPPFFISVPVTANPPACFSARWLIMANGRSEKELRLNLEPMNEWYNYIDLLGPRA